MSGKTVHFASEEAKLLTLYGINPKKSVRYIFSAFISVYPQFLKQQEKLADASDFAGEKSGTNLSSLYPVILFFADIQQKILIKVNGEELLIIREPSAFADFFDVAGSFTDAEKFFPAKRHIKYDATVISKTAKKIAAAVTEPEKAKIKRKTISAKSQSRNDRIKFFFILQKTP